MRFILFNQPLLINSQPARRFTPRLYDYVIDSSGDMLHGVYETQYARHYKGELGYLSVAAAVRVTTDTRTVLVTCRRHALHYKVVLQYMADYGCRHDTTKSWLGYRISDDAIADIVQR